MRILELFAGVGCFGLGLEAIGLPAPVWHCEWDPFARRVLARHWPGTPCFPDVRDVGDVGADVIVGGPPCQSISVAGKQLGPDDPRFLWPATMRVVAANMPKWCLFENPGALLTHDSGRTFLVHVVRPLAELGYLVRWDHCPASAVGAPHRRDRVWITAVHGGVAPGPADAVPGTLFGPATDMPEEWPRAGWYDGARWGTEQARWPVPRVDARGWPTPEAANGKDVKGGKRGPETNPSLAYAAGQWPTPDANAINDGSDIANWQARRDRCKEANANGNGFGVPLAMAARLAMWPTTTAQDAIGARNRTATRGAPGAKGGKGEAGHDGETLTDAAWIATGRWPTPTAEDSESTGAHGTRVDTLTSATAAWATPSARDPQASQATLDRNARPLNEQAWDASGHGKGKLNPFFSEWIMGVPQGWTSPDGEPLPRALPDWSGDLIYYAGRPAPAGMPLLVPHYKGRRERLRCVGNACLPRVVALVAATLLPAHLLVSLADRQEHVT